MANAKKLPSGNYRVQASVNINGKIIRKSFTDKNKYTAESKAAKWQAEKEEEEKIENITVLQAYEKYIKLKNSVLSPSTIRAYESMKSNSLQSIMEVKIEKLTQTQIQSAINILSATKSPKYVRNAYGLLTAVLNMFRPSFSPHITLPQKVKTEMYIPDDDDIKKLLKAVKDTEMEVAILLAAFGPMRRGEICALTSDDIHGNIITVNKSLVYKSKIWEEKPPKNFSSNRNIEYPSFVIERLKGIEGRIIKNTPASITDAFPDILKKIGIKHFRFHDLRHYSVSIQHALGVPDKYIMARGGWATNNTMNNVYNHILQKNQDEQTKNILNHFTEISKGL